MASPVYFYSIDAQMKAVIDRCVARWTNIPNKEFYYIMTVAEDSDNVIEHSPRRRIAEGCHLPGLEQLSREFQLFFGREGSVKDFRLVLVHEIAVRIFVGSGNSIQESLFQLGNEEIVRIGIVLIPNATVLEIKKPDLP